MNIKKTNELPLMERPYEKCLNMGPEALTDSELLAVILRTGTKGSNSISLSRQVLELSKSSQGLPSLMHLTVPELMQVPGIGKVKALQIKCIGELSRRISMSLAKERLSFHSPNSIADYYMESMCHEEQEIMLCMFFDTKTHLLGDEVISKGTVNASLVCPREIFLMAFRYHAVNIIMIHNHPSGDPSPSKEDILITKRILEAGELVGISLLDHIIIGNHTYQSMREKGII